MKTPFLGSAYTSRSRNLACQRAINIYPEVPEGSSGRSVGGWYGTPGLRLLGTIGAGPIRGLNPSFDGQLHVASGNSYYTVDNTWTGTLRGGLASNQGPVFQINNRTQNLMVDGRRGYVWDGTTFFPNVLGGVSAHPATAGYQDGFGIVNDAGTELFFQSDLNDLTVWQALNFSSADAQPDNILAVFDNQREVWLFGTKWTEVWINAGLPGFAFQRLQGVFIPHGLAAIASIALVGSRLAWLGEDKQGVGSVWMQNGYQAEKISTQAIDDAIQAYAQISDAIGFAYQQGGHFFYVLTFPTGNQTWVYDVTASAAMGFPVWHERAYFDNGLFSRHRANCFASFNGALVVGDYENGNLYALDLALKQDNGQPIKRLRSWPATEKSVGKPIRYNDLQIIGQTGLDVPDDANPQMMLRWSDDGGHTWSNEHLTSMGKTGETAKRVRWTRLGSTRQATGLDRVWEISCVENVPIAWTDAEMDAELA